MKYFLPILFASPAWGFWSNPPDMPPPQPLPVPSSPTVLTMILHSFISLAAFLAIVLVAVFIVQMLGKRKMLVPKMIVVLGIVAFAAPFLAYMIYGYVRFNLSPLQMLDAADITNRCGAYVITIGNEASRYLNCWIPQIFNSGELNAGPILGLPIIFIGLGFALKQRFANRKRFS